MFEVGKPAIALTLFGEADVTVILVTAEAIVAQDKIGNRFTFTPRKGIHDTQWKLQGEDSLTELLPYTSTRKATK